MRENGPRPPMEEGSKNDNEEPKKIPRREMVKKSALALIFGYAFPKGLEKLTDPAEEYEAEKLNLEDYRKLPSVEEQKDILTAVNLYLKEMATEFIEPNSKKLDTAKFFDKLHRYVNNWAFGYGQLEDVAKSEKDKHKDIWDIWTSKFPDHRNDIESIRDGYGSYYAGGLVGIATKATTETIANKIIRPSTEKEKQKIESMGNSAFSAGAIGVGGSAQYTELRRNYFIYKLSKYLQKLDETNKLFSQGLLEMYLFNTSGRALGNNGKKIIQLAQRSHYDGHRNPIIPMIEKWTEEYLEANPLKL